SAAKAGIIGFVMNLALEMREHNVFTTAYCPGGVASGMKANNATYRPARFGGPGEGEVAITEASKEHTSMAFFAPEDVAPMVLDAVRNNRAFAFDHPEQRAEFRRTYSSVVEACYDASQAWEAEHGRPEANPHGAALIR
ncbi:MAG TPA: SDR family NAD(P)-dependent oxidoreductase, partial [Novosphingobium sp.]|nr:SDR family NAD(P)-dependent oxidoreductase [Novosphingobium sp.]